MSPHASRQSTGKMTSRPHFAYVRGGGLIGPLFLQSGFSDAVEKCNPKLEKSRDSRFVQWDREGQKVP